VFTLTRRLQTGEFKANGYLWVMGSTKEVLWLFLRRIGVSVEQFNFPPLLVF
jgi:hypothetical protein